MLNHTLKSIALAVTAFAIAAPSLRAQSSAAGPSETELHIQHVQAGLVTAVVIKDDPQQAHSLADEMKKMHVTGVSIAVIHRGRIEWAKGFGLADQGGTPVTPETLFQAGSISKPVAAMAALRLVEQGKLSLDVDVNTILKSWKLPATPMAEGKPVTLRELLTHTGGTTVHGFPGYAKGEPVPTLVQVLDGEKPANTPAIRIEVKPGSKWNYSGGGFTIMQQMMIDVTNEPFPKLLQDTVLGPIGMTHSTYQQPLPADRSAFAATPYDIEGKPIPGGAHTYPEMAAAGLWTTPSDLALYAIEVETSLDGKSNHVLSQAMTAEMLKPGMGNWGLGLEMGGAATNPYFSHGGVNEGFESTFLAYDRGGEGAVVMTNAQGGSLIAEEVLRSIAAEYNWPDHRPVVRTSVTVAPKILADYAGGYQIESQVNLGITVEDGHLILHPPGPQTIRLYSQSNTEFFPLEADITFEFKRDADGNVTQLVMHQGGHDTIAERKKMP